MLMATTGNLTTLLTSHGG
jgi:hypothetical protein